MIALQLALPVAPVSDALPVMYYRIDNGMVYQWYYDNGERREFPPFRPGPNWKRWVDGLPLCVTWPDGGMTVFRLEAE